MGRHRIDETRRAGSQHAIGETKRQQVEQQQVDGIDHRREQPEVGLQPLLGEKRKKERKNSRVRFLVFVKQVLRQADRQPLLGADGFGAGQVVPGVDAAWSRADEDAQSQIQRQPDQRQANQHELHGLHLTSEDGIRHASPQRSVLAS